MKKRVNLPLADLLLLEINQLAAHWHKQMARLDDSLNGTYASTIRDAEHTEERLDGLWLRRRKQLAQPDADRFADEEDSWSESVFDVPLHIQPCS